MKFNKQIRELQECRAQGLTLAEVIILKMLKKRPLYIAELRDALDTDHGTLNRIINRMKVKGLVEKDKIPSHSGFQGAPLSALVRLKGTSKVITRVIRTSMVRLPRTETPVTHNICG